MSLNEPLLPAPPVAHTEAHSSSTWGVTRSDPYRWLHDRDSPEVSAHLEAENDYTEAVLAPTFDLRETIFQEIKARIKETDLSVPIVDGGWAYYSRTLEGSQYPVHCRRPAPADGSQPLPYADGDVEGERVLFDENVAAGESEFFDLGMTDVSPDHRWLLWASDTVGDELFRAYVRDLESGEDIDDGLEGLSPGSAWALDNRTFFYVRQDEAYRPHEIWRHEVGKPASEDTLVYREDDERFGVGVGRDKDDSFIYIYSSSKVSDEIRTIPAADPHAEPRLIVPRRDGVECSVSHREDMFIILTNENAVNFRVMTAPDDNPSPENWTELIAASESVTISGVDACAAYLTVFERTGGSNRIRLRYWDDGRFVEIDQPQSPSTVWAGANPDFNDTRLRYGYSSMTTPPSLFLLDPESGERQLLKQQQVLAGFDSTLYRTRRLWATSTDGTKVPISIVWRPGSGKPTDADQVDEPGPCVLYGYGAYEASIDPMFSSARLSLLDRGFSFAVVHPRGGGEMGRSWYQNGKFERKQNTFSDVIAAAKHLIDQGWTTSDSLVLRGGSAGGLMAGAVVNQAPDLFRAVVAEVPFVDALTTMLDPSQPLTVPEWEEWGNPDADEEIFRAMLAYSPYDNVSAQHYPAILATAGLHDTRVNYWEPAKWVQKIRAANIGDEPTLLWTELSAGHGGPSGRYDAWRDEARILAYVLWIVDATELVGNN